MRTHRRLLPFCVQIAITRCRILLPAQQRRRPPNARSHSKTSRTPKRRRPCHVDGMRQVLSSATEAEVGATFYGCQDAVPLRNTLSDLGNVHGATLIITDNACCDGILNNTVKQRRSKAMDMRFYWVKCRIAQGQFKLLWQSGRENIADYFTKLHSQVHQKQIQLLYVINSITSRGCNKGVLIGTNILYVPLVPTTSSRTRLNQIGTQNITAQPNART